MFVVWTHNRKCVRFEYRTRRKKHNQQNYKNYKRGIHYIRHTNDQFIRLLATVMFILNTKEQIITNTAIYSINETFEYLITRFSICFWIWVCLSEVKEISFYVVEISPEMVFFILSSFREKWLCCLTLLYYLNYLLFLFIRVLYILDPCMKYQSKELE